ncbi:MAG: sulfatase/phosphatase domain-containing protein, partial [Candidatus Bipolaricaulota bacterium]
PEELSPREQSRRLFVDLNVNYDAETAYLDAELERLHSYLAGRNMIENTLWIFTSDHGEGMGSHNYPSHPKFIYEELTGIPMTLHHPAWPNKGLVVTEPVHHVDVFPTLAELIGVAEPTQVYPFQGRSLVPLIDRDKVQFPHRYLFSERPRKVFSQWEDGEVFAIRDAGVKYIHHTEGTDELFDLTNDPFELSNLIGTAPDLEKKLLESVLTVYDGLVEQSVQKTEKEELSDEEVEELKALGYIE